MDFTALFLQNSMRCWHAALNTQSLFISLTHVKQTQVRQTHTLLCLAAEWQSFEIKGFTDGLTRSQTHNSRRQREREKSEEERQVFRQVKSRRERVREADMQRERERRKRQTGRDRWSRTKQTKRKMQKMRVITCTITQSLFLLNSFQCETAST